MSRDPFIYCLAVNKQRAEAFLEALAISNVFLKYVEHPDAVRGLRDIHIWVINSHELDADFYAKFISEAQARRFQIHEVTL